MLKGFALTSVLFTFVGMVAPQANPSPTQASRVTIVAQVSVPLLFDIMCEAQAHVQKVSSSGLTFLAASSTKATAGMGAPNTAHALPKGSDQRQ